MSRERTTFKQRRQQQRQQEYIISESINTSNMGPIDWLAQANKLAVDAAEQYHQSTAKSLPSSRMGRSSSQSQVGSEIATTLYTMKLCNNNNHKINSTPSTNSHLLHSHMKNQFHHHIKRSRIRRALGATSYSIVLLLACLMPAQNLLSVQSLRNNNNNNQAADNIASSADIISNNELKQQMELIRGASSVELGRSNVNLPSGSSAPLAATSSSVSSSLSTVVRAQRSEPSPPTCGYPGSPAHASVTFNTSNVVTGTAASYTCDNGYELLGPPRRICQANGTWSPVGIPFCVLNVGLGKAAMQSSTAGQGSAQRAVDGSTSPYFQASTCTMTDAEQSPWWYVNLLEPYLVQIVRIDFGMACCAKGQKATIAVRVGNNRPDLGNNPLCNRYHGHIEEGKPLFLPCTRPAPGAFVSIHLEAPSGSSLSICETFIYTDHALSIEQCPSFRDQQLGSTATYNGKCYLFHNTQALPFEGARKYCEQRGGSLVDETSPALQGFLSWELYRRHRNDQVMGQYWLGAVRDARNQDNWKWINGKDVQITFWNSLQRAGNCSRFDGSKGWLWSDADCQQNLNFICQYRPLSCGKPEKPTNSTLITKNIDNGTVIEYQCAPGNLLMGPKSRTCLPTGFFSEFAPKCKYLDCQFPAHIPNGDYKLHNSSTSYQSVVTYFCQPGYQLYGRATLTCDVDERWNGPPPRCEPLLCPSPVPPTNGYVTVTSNVTIPGTQATYECRSGYELVGERHLACSLSGSWDHSFPYCRVDKRLSLIPTLPNSSATAPKVHFPQSQTPNINRVQPIAASYANTASNSTGANNPNPSLPKASLNGLPGSFIGASQAATATQDPGPNSMLSSSSTQSPIGSSSTGSHPENNPIKPDNMPPQRPHRPQGVQNQQQQPAPSSSSSEAPLSPIADIAPSTSTQTSNLNSPIGSPSSNKASNQRHQRPEHNSSQNGQIATTNSISVQHPSSSSHGQTVSSIIPTTTTANNLMTSSSSSPSSFGSSASSTQQAMANLPSSSTSTTMQTTTTRDQHHPSSTSSTTANYPNLVHNQPSNIGHRQHGSNINRIPSQDILASSVFGVNQPVRSQNSLASTKYSLDGIIATAILGGFIFLGAIITIIVIVLRRRKNGHSPSIDAQTICTFDSSGGAENNNGFYRNYQQAWENLRFATAPGVQPKSSGSHHMTQHGNTANPNLMQHQQQHMLHNAALGLHHQSLKTLTDTMLGQQQQLHHAHLMANGVVLGGGGSSQSSSLGGSGGGGSGSGSGNDPLLHSHGHHHQLLHHSRSSQNVSSGLPNQYTNLQGPTSHQLRAAQRRSLQLIAANSNGQQQNQMATLCGSDDEHDDDDDEQGVLSADESAAMHRRQYRLSSSTNAIHQHNHHIQLHNNTHQYMHTNEGFRDSNELTVGPDTRSVNTNARGSRIFSVVQNVASNQGAQAPSRLGAPPAPVAGLATSSSGNNVHRRHPSSRGSGASQHQRLVGSSSATTTSSPSTSTRSSRASPQHSDDVDLDRLAYGSNWQQHRQ